MTVRPRISAPLAQRKRWREFLDFAEEHGSPQWLFRGVADRVNHRLVPKIGRQPKRYSANIERVLFENFKRRARQFIPGSLSDWDWLALGQHHGLPTRLLDWSTNPLVAAFFAVSSEPRAAGSRVYAYQASDVIDLVAEPDPLAIGGVKAHVPSAITPRIVAQRGVFTAHPDPRAELVSTTGSPGLDFFDVDETDRPYFERRLFGLAIDPGVIGADLDGLCSALNWKYERGFALGKVVF